ncbi:Dehydrogenase/reductase SDR family member 11 [Orchesella cincta]|uniref:Dehydrogenase/reductase SDR family member 11 n=1 Tax=Orchesella cincta TaxID=48709 RepID=A0A1D2ME96_ORCCI|nr:Dehydrogenase/reductase SDR family member 11 [Orchesella cincta]
MFAELKGDEMTDILSINVVGLVLCSNLAVKSMLERNIVGHVINVSSMLGHNVVGILNFYAATKHAVTAISKGLRMEIAAKGSRIKVTQISSERVETNFHPNLFHDAEAGRKHSKAQILHLNSY